MDKLFVFNIQKYSIHDGDGIRTTIFFKGCPIRCAWCHNPESQRFGPELLWNQEKCTNCGACVEVCPTHAMKWNGSKVIMDRSLCTQCGKCVEACLNNVRELAGKYYTVEELVEEAEKDQMFYEESGGGVTLSGGEVMAQEPFHLIVELTRRLHEKGIPVAIDTSGFAPWERFEALLPFADVFLYDLKAMDPEKHKRLIGAENNLILDNLRKLSQNGAKVYLRMPLVGGLNTDDEDILPVIQLMQQGVRAERVYLLPYHNTGKSKYARLGRLYDINSVFNVPSPERLEEIAELFRKNGFPNVRIGG